MQQRSWDYFFGPFEMNLGRRLKLPFLTFHRTLDENGFFIRWLNT